MLHDLPDLSRLLDFRTGKIELKRRNLITRIRLRRGTASMLARCAEPNLEGLVKPEPVSPAA